MNAPAEVQLFGAAITAVILHCMIKCNSLLNLARKANVDFNWKRDYLQRDSLPILISFVSIILWFFLYKEFSTNWAWLDAWKVASFAAVALFGSYITQMILSNGEKTIKNLIDKKTNQLNRTLGLPEDSKTDMPAK